MTTTQSVSKKKKKSIYRFGLVVFLETDVKVAGTENNKTEPNRPTQPFLETRTATWLACPANVFLRDRSANNINFGNS